MHLGFGGFFLEEHFLKNEGGLAPELRVRILGVGGAGVNALEAFSLSSWGPAVELYALNTDLQALGRCQLANKHCIGKKKLKGLGAGGEMALAREAALEDLKELESLVAGADVVCLLAGLGGGTGGAIAPMLAELAAEHGAFVLAFVSLPFPFEGARRHQHSEESLAALRASCDIVVPMPNSLLLQQARETDTIEEAFASGTRWVQAGLESLLHLLLRPGLINLELSHLKQTFNTHGGRALFGLGRGQGPDAAAQALESLSLCPLLHLPEATQRADRLLIQCIGGRDLSLSTVHALAKTLSERYSSSQQTLLAAAVDPEREGILELCVLGTTAIGARKTVRHRKWSAVAASAPDPARPSDLKTPLQQAHFDFFQYAQAGAFASPQSSVHEAQDLDVPTYLRRGIRVSL